MIVVSSSLDVLATQMAGDDYIDVLSADIHPEPVTFFDVSDYLVDAQRPPFAFPATRPLDALVWIGAAGLLDACDLPSLSHAQNPEA
jgi:hypothetical protein